MEQIEIVLNDMEDVKREIDNCQKKAVTSVVELGYILRKTDDAELFRSAGYTSIFKFAEAEYGWNQSQTSRFMDINREFSEGGYSTVLKEKYRGYGQAKLSEMLTLPESIRDELEPDMKRDEIREVKREMKKAAEEERENTFAAKVTFEPTDNNFLTASIKELLWQKAFEQKIEKLWPHIKSAAEGGKVDQEGVAMAVSGTGFGFARAGEYMYFFKNEDIKIARGSEKKSYGYEDLVHAAAVLKNPAEMTLEEWYEEVFGRTLPKEEKLATKTTVKKSKREKPKKPTVEQENGENGDLKEEKECQNQTKLSSFAEEEKISYEKESENDETSIMESDSEQVVPAHNMEEPEMVESEVMQPEVVEADGCPVCSGRVPITSNDGEFRLYVKRNGLGRIERGIYHAILEMKFCPECGEELVQDED